MQVLLVVGQGATAQAFVDWMNTAGIGFANETDGTRAMVSGAATAFDAVVLDDDIVKPPAQDIIGHWRNCGVNVPVMVLTSQRDWSYTVNRLDEGSDQVVTKPFHPEFGVALLRAMLRRRRWNLGSAA